MKKVFFNLVLLFSLNAFSQETTDLEDVFNVQNIAFTREIISVLSSDYLQGRNIEKPSISRTQTYLENIFRTYNLKAYFSTYRHSFKIKDTLYGHNLVGVFRGNPRKKTAILITANYDNLGIIYDPDANDYIYNGANDNASAVAALLQIVYLFNIARPNDNVIFALTAGKRFGRIGAGMLADTLSKHDHLYIRAVINLEMLGRPLTTVPNNLISLQDTTANIVDMMNDYISPVFISRDISDENKNRSEHIPFHNILKVPSITLTSFNLLNDDNFMTPQDDIDNINLDYLQRTIGRISFALLKICEDLRMINFREKAWLDAQQKGELTEEEKKSKLERMDFE